MAAPFELGLLAATFGFAGGRFALAITFFDFPVGLRARFLTDFLLAFATMTFSLG
jgi:hypothetical protein